MMVVCLLSFAAASTTIDQTTLDTVVIECVSGGVNITENRFNKYEVCAEEYCVILDKPKSQETVLFPPEITFHDHTVQWKAVEENRVNTFKVQCPATPFCERVECWLCTANAFNPECNPTAALIALTTMVYLIVAVLYTLCYVPLVLRKKFRICAMAVVLWIRCLSRIVIGVARLLRRRRRVRVDIEALLHAPLVAIVMVIMISFTQAETIQSNKCYVETTNMVKLNSFNQEACIRLTHTWLRGYRFTWKSMQKDVHMQEAVRKINVKE
ncbi:hypothetical protein Q1695_003728 [Nippostrongylus brasiliensis]|nr:hypothetical protein Q1695_003728 [Nippostrongylus brasiliensis]